MLFVFRLSFCLCVYVQFCLSGCLFLSLSLCPRICLSVSQVNHRGIIWCCSSSCFSDAGCLSVCVSVCSVVCLTVSLSPYLYCLFVSLSLCPCVYLLVSLRVCPSVKLIIEVSSSAVRLLVFLILAVFLSVCLCVALSV